MKKQSTKAISKKVFTFLFVAFVFCIQGPTSYGQKADNATVSKNPEISYEGLRGKKLIFNINYKNELGEPFQLFIKNDDDEVLYVRDYEAAPLNTKLLFSEVPENCKLTFYIKAGKKELSQAFQINTQVKTVEEYVVTGI